MRYRPVKKPAPMPENPYHRIFTPMPGEGRGEKIKK